MVAVNLEAIWFEFAEHERSAMTVEIFVFCGW